MYFRIDNKLAWRKRVCQQRKAEGGPFGDIVLLFCQRLLIGGVCSARRPHGEGFERQCPTTSARYLVLALRVVLGDYSEHGTELYTKAKLSIQNRGDRRKAAEKRRSATFSVPEW